jgi:hypothetical protein
LNEENESNQPTPGDGAIPPINKAALGEALARLSLFDDQSVEEWTVELEAAIQKFTDTNSRHRIIERQGAIISFNTYTRHSDGIISGGYIHDADLVSCQPFLTSKPIDALIAKIPVSSPRIVPILLSLLIVRDAGWNNAASVERSFQLLAISRPGEIEELIAKDKSTGKRRESGRRGGEAKAAQYSDDKKQANEWYQEYIRDSTPKHQRISKIVRRFERAGKSYPKQTVHKWVRGLHMTASDLKSSPKHR